MPQTASAAFLAAAQRPDAMADFLISRDGRPFLVVTATLSGARRLLTRLEFGEGEWSLTPAG